MIRCKDANEGLIRANGILKRAKAAGKSYDEILNEMNQLVIGTNANDWRSRNADKQAVEEISDACVAIFENHYPSMIAGIADKNGEMTNYLQIIYHKDINDLNSVFHKEWTLKTPVAIYHVYNMFNHFIEMKEAE